MPRESRWRHWPMTQQLCQEIYICDLFENFKICSRLSLRVQYQQGELFFSKVPQPRELQKKNPNGSKSAVFQKTFFFFFRKVAVASSRGPIKKSGSLPAKPPKSRIITWGCPPPHLPLLPPPGSHSSGADRPPTSGPWCSLTAASFQPERTLEPH